MTSCVSTEVLKPELPALTDGLRAGAARGFRFPDQKTVVFPERSFSVAYLDGPLVVPRGKVCDVVEVVLKELQVTHSCKAVGEFAFYSNGQHGASVLATVVHALRSAGYVVDLSSDSIVITGSGKDAGAIAGTPAPTSSEDVKPAGTGVVMFNELAFQGSSANTKAIGSPSFVLRRFPASGATVEAVKALAAENGLNVSAVALEGDVAVYGPRSEVELVASTFADDEMTISAQVANLEEGTVSAIKESHPDLVVSYDAARSVLYVRGSPDVLRRSAATIAGFTREPAQIRTEVIVAAFRSNVGFAVASGLSAGAITGVDGGTVSLPVDAELSVVLSAVERSGSVSILSQPVLTGREGIGAKFVAATQVPVPRTIVSEGVVTTDYEYLDAGTILNVTARLTDAGLIALDLEIELSSVSAGTPPTFDRRTINTSVTVAPGQSVALAGLASLERRKDKEGFPLLSGIGGSAGISNSHDELVILIRPTLHGVVGASLRANAFGGANAY